ncbi:MAG: 4Fe-4S ferredoxin iron-sulfur binding domain protein [Firmicutes bacterium]|nr:4Fe-4S ferredoxin iron-sulfur binding domain protein [Bacillota bacterium]
MKVCIIVFSPSGHTLKAAEMMKAAMEEQALEVQVLNITGQHEVFKNNRLKDYLLENVNRHDVLCVGGPVYAGHLEGNVRNLIKALPEPDEQWGKLAIPFITYGGLHSSVALTEAGALFCAGRRINIMGVKMAACHSLSQKLRPGKINEGKPGPEEERVAREMARRLKLLSSQSTWKEVRQSFGYASWLHKIVLKFLDQDYFHKKYRTVYAKPEVCNGCGICQKFCPIKIIEIVGQKAVRVDNGSYCILCGECYHRCPRNAVVHDFIEQKITKKLNNEKEKYHEFPQSAVYPIVWEGEN